MMKGVVVVAMAAAMAGCSASHPLDKRYVSVRPNYGDRALPNPGEAPEVGEKLEMVNPDPVRRPPAPVYREVITGTWTFTTPPTTTRVEKKDAGFSQYSLYMGRQGGGEEGGRPAGNETPLVVITVSPDARSVAESEPEKYKVSGTRTYALNGNVAKEWTGTTSDGASFSELVISKPGEKEGDKCHAIAVARSAEGRRVALEILGSITWKRAEEAE